MWRVLCFSVLGPEQARQATHRFKSASVFKRRKMRRVRDRDDWEQRVGRRRDSLQSFALLVQHSLSDHSTRASRGGVSLPVCVMFYAQVNLNTCRCYPVCLGKPAVRCCSALHHPMHFKVRRPQARQHDKQANSLATDIKREKKTAQLLPSDSRNLPSHLNRNKKKQHFTLP